MGPEDEFISDACRATPVQEALISATLQGNTRYIYHRIWDVQYVDLAKLKLAMSLAFTNSDLLRSTFVVSGSNMYRVVRRDLALPWKEWSTNLNYFYKEDLRQGIELSEAFIRINILNQSILVVSLHYALFDYWSNLYYCNDTTSICDGFQPQIHPTFGSYHTYLKNRNDSESVARAPSCVTGIGPGRDVSEFSPSKIDMEHPGLHGSKIADEEPESLSTSSNPRNLDEQPQRDFWELYLSDAKSSLLNHASVDSLSEVARRLDLDLSAMSSALGVSPKAMLYAAWALILSLHLDIQDVIFATTVSDQVPTAEDSELNGATDLVIPQRVVIEGCDSLLDLVLAVNSSLEKIAEHFKSGMRRALAASGRRSGAVLDTMVNFQTKGAEGKAIKPVTQPRASLQNWSANCIRLDVEDQANNILLRLEGRMEQRRLQFLLDQVAEILTVASSKPQTSLDSAATLTNAEISFLAPQGLDESPAETLIGGFERAARKFPNRTAVQWEMKEEMKYCDLENHVCRLAAFLGKHGVKEQCAVPMLLEKSPLMIISILAVMKLGAAYIPLSPENPAERNAFIISKAASAPALTDSQCCRLLSETKKFNTIILDTVDWSSWAPLQDTVSISPKHSAYLLYTSGSTGQPKGVTVTHGACATAIKSIIDFEGKQSGEFRALQFSNYVFDVSLYDFFVTLHTGATLCIAPTPRLLNDLAGVINEMRVDHAFLTPTVARMLNPTTVPSIKSLTVGGEQMTQDIIDKWASRVRLYNGYGPTECSVLVTMKKVEATILARNIGTPLPSVNAFILEKNSTRFVPYGAIGELCFSGPQLSEGYFKRPDLTALVFQHTDCISNVTRFYRSGDLARWISPNELECLGRKDAQVKINGHRIELGEIETAFLKTGLAKECAAVTAERVGSQRLQLVAFVAFEGSHSCRSRNSSWSLPSSTEVRERLVRLRASLRGLTPYMIPKKVIPIQSLPKLPSGKTNRKQLVESFKLMGKDELATYSFDSIRTLEPATKVSTIYAQG